MTNWQPIETAPVREEFGQIVSDWMLVRWPVNRGHVVAIAMREYGVLGWLAQLPNGGCEELDHPPTHWSALPETPK